MENEGDRNAQVWPDRSWPQAGSAAHGYVDGEQFRRHLGDFPGQQAARAPEAVAGDAEIRDPARIGLEKSYGTTVTGAARESIGTKIGTHLVPYEYVLAAAVGLEYGKEKYVARNFEKGLSETALLGSIERHLQAIKDGEDIDGPSGLPHYCLLASSVAMYVNNLVQGTIIHDLPPPKNANLDVGQLSVLFNDILHQRCNFVCEA